MTVNVYIVRLFSDIVYVGITNKSIRARWLRHCKGVSVLSRAIYKHGPDKFSVELAYEAVNRLEAAMVERGLIAQYGTMLPGGYNLTSGGENTTGDSPATREKKRLNRFRPLQMAQWASAQENARLSNVGRVRPIEERVAISKAVSSISKDPEFRAKKRAGLRLYYSQTTAEQRRARTSGMAAANKGTPRPEWVREKLRMAWTPESRKRFGDARTGIKFSLETRMKMSAKAKARRARSAEMGATLNGDS